MVALVLAIFLLAACDSPDRPHSLHERVTLETIRADTAAQAPVDGVRTLEWEDLVPAEFHAGELLTALGVDALEDDDPRAPALMEKIADIWKEAPVVEALDGVMVRLPGFVVPLEGRGRRVEEFLLVPYYGACIHVPPPPANQTVHVLTDGHEVRIRRLFETVWVTGIMQVEHTSSRLAEAGYRLHVIDVSPYDG